ncbi:hypothetical protein [Bradyrhizobium iriomotense]|uniref:GAF domain-containing protein n=1 Tax=Bradyrhizobium iriomotense TaxID=441950 RepID=A0ABQ6B532_9BRAD|nr:hypothetical protein [Bradyrhizobium iriomotense]GLR89502.1 hypothetical protein GCM10007857_62150 [Bradyrhizobium iriomotense]
MTANRPTLDDMTQLVDATTRGLDLADACRTLDGIAARRYDYKLFTVLRLCRRDSSVERVHSSDPVAYPLLGRKRTPDTVWGKVVLTDGKVLVSRTPDDIRENFSDYETIFALGVGSMINVPILWNGIVRGSANISFAGDGYVKCDPADLQMLCGIIAPVVVATSSCEM